MNHEVHENTVLLTVNSVIMFLALLKKGIVIIKQFCAVSFSHLGIVQKLQVLSLVWIVFLTDFIRSPETCFERFSRQNFWINIQTVVEPLFAEPRLILLEIPGKSYIGALHALFFTTLMQLFWVFLSTLSRTLSHSILTCLFFIQVMNSSFKLFIVQLFYTFSALIRTKLSLKW